MVNARTDSEAMKPSLDTPRVVNPHGARKTRSEINAGKIDELMDGKAESVRLPEFGSVSSSGVRGGPDERI